MSGVVVEQRNVAEAAHVQVGRVRIEQVLVNVMCNAVESIQSRRRHGWSGEGRIIIDVEHDHANVVCTVSDNGAGLEAGVESAAFEPFFTTKAAEGTGLGLAICRSVLDSAQGDICLSAGDSEGAVIKLRLPLLIQSSDIVAG